MKALVTVGTRKKSVARATIKDGSGIIRVNKKLLDNVMPEMARMKIKEPLIIAGDVAGKYNINVNVSGGGVISQADAARLAVAKAILAANSKLKKEFLEYDRTLLIADARQREARKPNTHGNARGKTQKSYR
ncbi:30S ribosomal protein S9 [Candidatus Woesearchaeota archaeon]|nr:30S ribosomal protein S9 [Candidatus Woesearchaeota archaeon]